jgi:hypothetical protein
MELYITSHDCLTGEIIERPMNEMEIVQHELDQKELLAETAKAEAKAQAKAELLERLGITADEAKLLLA